MSFALALGAPLAADADVIALHLPGIRATRSSPRTTLCRSIRSASSRSVTPSQNTASGSPGHGGAGKATFSNLSLVKRFGESSAPIFLAAAHGEHLETATISFYRMKQSVPTKCYTITLRGVTVASQAWVGNSNGVDAADAESVELAYERISRRDWSRGCRTRASSR